MMKRITYISHFAEDLSKQDIEAIGDVAIRRNQRDEITGVLLCSGGMFFQVIEGEDGRIDDLFIKILADSRHTDVLCLKTEMDVQERQFPEWSMKVFNLDETSGILMKPVRSLIEVLGESHSVLEKYTQPTVLKFLKQGMNPLDIPPTRREKVILFSDIVSFSRFSSALPVEKIVAMVNTYFSICSKAIVDRGGEVTKFIGDCVMAYFNKEQVNEALETGMDILSSLESLRRNAPPQNPIQALYAGIGVSFGEVIEGNIGSNVKMDFTVLGDCVNQAAFLEGLTRTLPRFLVFSEDVRRITNTPRSIVSLGLHSLKAKDSPAALFSIDDPVTLKPVEFDSGPFISSGH